MHVEELMTRELVTCRPDDTLATAAERMWKHDIGFLPIVGQESRLVGVLTDRDCVIGAHKAGRPLAEIPVSFAMTTRTFTCAPEDTLGYVEGLMREHQVRRLPVLDRGGRIVGVVGQNDLVREAAHERGSPHAEITSDEVTGTLAEIGEPPHPRVTQR